MTTIAEFMAENFGNKAAFDSSVYTGKKAGIGMQKIEFWFVRSTKSGPLTKRLIFVCQWWPPDSRIMLFPILIIEPAKQLALAVMELGEFESTYWEDRP